MPEPPKSQPSIRNLIGVQGASLHGESAARRQAITELLFFASVGDLARCKKITSTWSIEPKDPNCCDYDRRTPLHLAAAEGCYSVAEWLLQECEVAVNPVDRFHRTPLEDAVRGDHGEMANLLMSCGGKVMEKDGLLVDLSESRLAGNVRIFGELNPEWEVDPRQLVFLEKVGEGEFGIVYKAKYLGTMVAVKVLKNNDAVALGDFRTELNVLQKVHHPHCVQFVGAVTRSSPYMIITEFMACGSLADIFKRQEYPGLRRAAQLALDCARGIAYLHNHAPMSIIHRDLKPANLMVGGHHVETPAQRKLLVQELGTVKLADFGLSKSLKLGRSEVDASTGSNASGHGKDAGSAAVNGQATPSGPPSSVSGVRVADSASSKRKVDSYKLTGETGSYRYMAPEVFRHDLYNHKVDQYAFAMIAYQLFEGVAPFAALNPIQAARCATNDHLRPTWGAKNRWGHEVPQDVKDLIARCWDAKYEMRPEMTEVITALEAVLEKLPPEARGSGGGAGDSPCCSIQ